MTASFRASSYPIQKCLPKPKPKWPLRNGSFDTPVLFLSDGLNHINQRSRLDGMDNFFQILNSRDLKNFDLKKIKNTKRHIPFVNKMRKEIIYFKEYKGSSE